MRLIDTHCHLVSDKLRANIAAYIMAAKAQGVQKIINIAYDPETVNLLLSQLEAHPILYGAVGIQPHDAQTFTEAEAQRIQLIAKTNLRIVAIGEIGLDNFHKLAPMEQQIACFERFLEVALEVKLPIVVHVRETHQAVATRIKSFCTRGGTGVIHCFTGSVSEAEEFLALGMHISLSGIVTFKNADGLRDVARMVPAHRLLIETDSPYLAPVPERGKTNEPAFVRHTCSFIAALRGVTPEALAEQTTHNAESLFTRMKAPQTHA